MDITDAPASLATFAYQYDYSYDGNGNIASIVDVQNSAHSQAFTPYDAVDRLVNATQSDTYGTRSYDYDGFGNRIALDQATNAYQQPFTPGTRTYDYDAAGRIATLKIDSVDIAHYTYNTLGQRHYKKRVATGTETRYYYDQDGQLISEWTGGQYTEYVYHNGVPIAVLRDTGTSFDVYNVHTDHLGTPKALTNALNVVWQAQHTPFGSAQVNEDPDGDGLSQTLNVRFPGQYFDAESGLHYNYFRYYDPSTGRYFRSDPIGLEGGINTYLYANANPERYVDLRGLATLAAPGAIAGGSLAGPPGALAGGIIGFGLGIFLGDQLLGRDSVSDSALHRGNDAVITKLNAEGQDKRTIPWPEKKSRRWVCFCRADANGRSADLTCKFHKSFAFGWGEGQTMQMALQAAERAAKATLGASSVHHVQCKCTGPNDERRNRQ